MGEAPEPTDLTEAELNSLRLLGFLYLRLGLAARAVRLFQALAALVPQDVQIALSLAAAHLEDERPETALAVLERPPLAGAQEEPAARLLKAQSLWRLERREEASALMDRHLSAANGA